MKSWYYDKDDKCYKYYVKISTYSDSYTMKAPSQKPVQKGQFEISKCIKPPSLVSLRFGG